jgi:hypothetical protein
MSDYVKDFTTVGKYYCRQCETYNCVNIIGIKSTPFPYQDDTINGHNHIAVMMGKDVDAYMCKQCGTIYGVV